MICVCFAVRQGCLENIWRKDLELPAKFPFSDHFAQSPSKQCTGTRGLTSEAQELQCAEKETWNGIGKQNLQEEEQKGLSHLPDITSHVTPTHHNLSWVQVLEENLGFFQDSRQGEDHRSARSQWRSLSRSVLCWGKISLRNRNCHGSLGSFRS